DAAKLESKNAVAAANIYRDLLKDLQRARNLTQHAIHVAQEARNLAHGQKKEAAETGEQAGKLFRHNPHPPQTFTNTPSAKAKRVVERLEAVGEEMARQEAELEGAKAAAVFELDHDQLQQTSRIADALMDKLRSINESLQQKAPDVARIAERVAALAGAAKVE